MRYLFFITILLCNWAVFSQESYSLTPIEKFALDADRFIGVDNLGDLYFIKNRTLHKTSTRDTYAFKDFQLGRMGSVDLLNPLRITLFYPDFNTAIVLDNRLNEVNRIPFVMKPPFLNVINATTANDNRLWIFNQDSQQLELYNYRNENLQVLSRPIAEDYRSHISNFNFCYVLTENKLRMYNIYGSYLKSIPNEGFLKISLNRDRLLVQTAEGVFLLTEELTKTTPVSTSQIAVKDLYLSEDFVYIYDGESVHKMKLTPIKK
ncbi:MAG TPA: hypothetical protein VFD80_00760 [Flavobacteriaceae bacterium]|nr:hypothetical protein [Flavobacteriaceae bacterium]